jgi:mannose-6-phosphate isomerase-like protein (cupin superfamily)
MTKPTAPDAPGVHAVQTVLPAPDLDATLAFFTERLGYRVESVVPADDPSTVVVAAHGHRIRLDRHAAVSPGHLVVTCDDPDRVGEGATTVVAPNGTVVELVAADPPLVVPDGVDRFVLSSADDGSWHIGRAGMRYRDLIPDRLGGRFVASHIHIPDGGPVPDYVHFHKVRFQMIFCRRGWARLVYEDQGEPFLLEAGDCVLQPPRIRHRVLESSDDLEVVEIGCPAVHETIADPATSLPTGIVDPDRDFGGQRFVRHRAATAVWAPWRIEGYEARSIGFAAATDGLAEARVVRPASGSSTGAVVHEAEFVFCFVLDGSVALWTAEHGEHRLGPGDSVVLPSATAYRFAEAATDLELLEVTLPAVVTTTSS